jgi:hypothetical protein
MSERARERERERERKTEVLVEFAVKCVLLRYEHNTLERQRERERFIDNQ